MAPPRDAYVKAKTLADLAAHFKGQLAPGALRHVRARLRREAKEEMKRFKKGTADALAGKPRESTDLHYRRGWTFGEQERKMYERGVADAAG